MTMHTRTKLIIAAILLVGGIALSLTVPRPGTPSKPDMIPGVPGSLGLHVTGAQPHERMSDAAAYRLRIWGMVDSEVVLTLDEIKALPVIETKAPLECVVGWTDKANWSGARIRDIVDRAKPLPQGKFLVFRDDKDFSATLSMAYVQSGKPILAYQVNGQELPREHGWPLRVVAPEKWGYKWVKWVTEIEVTDRGDAGTYESKGYSLNGNIGEPMYEKDKPGHRTGED